MKITYYCTRRGKERIAWIDFLAKARQDGYDGIETALPTHPDERTELLRCLAMHDLKLKGIWGAPATPDFTQHARELETALDILLDAKPFLISLQTGKDHFSFDRNTQLLLMSKRVAHERQVTILQETQRGKCCFALHVARQYLKAMPSLRLDLDLSQWYTVTGNYLEDQPEALELALSRTAHIQARVGEMDDLDRYLQQWDKVVERHRSLQSPALGFTCGDDMKNILMNRYG